MSILKKKPKHLVIPAGSSIEDDERRTSRNLVRVMGMVVVAALLWAATFNLDEVTRGMGKVIPSSREQVIQSLDSGVLAELLVHEGDAVVKGQVLLRIDDARAGPVYREAREKWIALSAQAARLQAEAYGMPLQFPAQVQKEPLVMRRETQAYHARKRALDEQMTPMRESQAQLAKELALTTPLVEQGVMSEVELLRLKRQYADMQSHMAERHNRYLTDASNEWVKVESELSQTRENTLAREDALTHTTNDAWRRHSKRAKHSGNRARERRHAGGGLCQTLGSGFFAGKPARCGETDSLRLQQVRWPGGGAGPHQPRHAA
jgi:adhesin transport system membrane fusion protein